MSFLKGPKTTVIGREVSLLLGLATTLIGNEVSVLLGPKTRFFRKVGVHLLGSFQTVHPLLKGERCW